MATIGSVTKREDGRYEGELKTLTMRTDVSIIPVTDKVSPGQPDYRVIAQGIEIGAGWVRKGQTSGKDYVSLSIAAPEFGATEYARLSLPAPADMFVITIQSLSGCAVQTHPLCVVMTTVPVPPA